MKKARKLLIGLLLLVAIVGMAALLFINTLKPTYEGEKTLVSLENEVQVYFDGYGIPHIYAQNEMDAARSLGYVHAQDRLWQMEVLRRIATGRLSEVFGSQMLSTDKFFLALGIDEATDKTIAEMDMSQDAMAYAKAYLEGINTFIEEGPTPIEYYLTGIDKQAFEINDIYNTLGYMAFSFAMAHKTDPLVSNIKNKLGPAYLEDLEIDVDPETLWIKNHKEKSGDTIPNSMATIVNEALGGLSIPLFEGSNSWVLAADKTKNGKVIFANDPHIGFSQPAVWYEAHIQTPTYEKYGYHLGGVPFPLLGHDRHMAYGMTMFENDDVDFYYEEPHPTNPTKYKLGEGWATYEEVSKTIKVKDSTPVSFSYRKSVHGPILNGIADQINGERPIAMWWIYTQERNEVMQALYGMTHAENMEAFQNQLPKIHAPGLNIMYGDAEGNVAWWATAKLYRNGTNASTKMVMNDSIDSNGSRRYLDFTQNPQAINPPWNYVYSANNQPDSIAGVLYPGYYLPENRAKRIVELLDRKDDWDKEAVSAMATDVTSPVNMEVVSNLVPLIDLTSLTETQKSALDIISNWKGDYEITNKAPLLYHRWVYSLLKQTFEDELEEELFKQLLETHLLKRLIAPMAAKKTSVWWDNTRTSDRVETKLQIVNQSFVKAMESIEEDFGMDDSKWTWGQVHTLEHPHPIGQVEALRSFFNVGPFPAHGTREVINNLAFQYNESGFYNVTAGPSTRRIIDFSDIENGLSILPTGQSGNPFSRHYEDQAEMYVKGEFRKMMMNEKEIKETSEALLTFKP